MASLLRVGVFIMAASTHSQGPTQTALWDVYVTDFIEKTCELVLENVPIEEAKDFQSVWKDEESLVVILPFGFSITSNGCCVHDPEQTELEEVK